MAEFNSNGFLLLQNFLDKTECEKILDLALVHLKHNIEPIKTDSATRSKVDGFEELGKGLIDRNIGVLGGWEVDIKGGNFFITLVQYQ